MKQHLIHSLAICSLILSSATSSLADSLPTLKEKGWISYYAGFLGSGFKATVDTEGAIEFYFTPRKDETLNSAWPLATKIRVQRRDKGGDKWVTKNLTYGAFTPTPFKLGQKNVEYTTSVTGGVKFKIMITADKNGINIESKWANTPKDAAEADYRLVLETSMPTMMATSSKYDEKELKSKTRGDTVKIEFKSDKGLRIPLYEVSDPQKITASQPTSITLKADKIGRKRLTWSLIDKKDKGALELEFRSTSNRFLDGFSIRTILIDENGAQLNKGIRLEYK